jgi:hypothetical protein
MQDLEKNFGQQIFEESLVSAEDLLSLQTIDETLEENLASGCTFCSWTCWNTAATH